jgi:hypothetical protein
MRLDALAHHLSERRAAIHLKWGAATAARLIRRYPDEARRPTRVQQRIAAAKLAITSVRLNTVERVLAHPECYGGTGAVRTLAADALLVEAKIAEREAKAKLGYAADPLAPAPQAGNDGAGSMETQQAGAPPRLPADLIEGGLVDRKRMEALAIDPRLCDVVNGGQRALIFTRDSNATLRLRLQLAEQQVAHLQRKRQLPLPEVVATLTAQREVFFNAALATHDELTQQQPGRLTVGQARLLAELDKDIVTLAGRIAAVHYETAGIEGALRIARAHAEIAQLEKQRLETAVAIAHRVLDAKNDPKLAAAEAAFEAAQAAARRAREHLAYARKVERLGSVNTAADVAIAAARNALAASAPHFKTGAHIPGSQTAISFASRGLQLTASELASTITEGYARSCAESLMIDELGFDPAQAGAMVEAFQVRTAAAAASTGRSGVRERARSLVDGNCAHFGSDARAALADALTFDVARKRYPLATPQHGTVAQLMQHVEIHYARLEHASIKEGVRPEHARALALEGKTALFDDALAGTNDLLRAAVKMPAPDADSAAGAAAATRILLDKLTVHVHEKETGKVATPLNAVPLSLAGPGTPRYPHAHADAH